MNQTCFWRLNCSVDLGSKNEYILKATNRDLSFVIDPKVRLSALASSPTHLECNFIRLGCQGIDLKDGHWLKVEKDTSIDSNLLHVNPQTFFNLFNHCFRDGYTLTLPVTCAEIPDYLSHLIPSEHANTIVIQVYHEGIQLEIMESLIDLRECIVDFLGKIDYCPILKNLDSLVVDISGIGVRIRLKMECNEALVDFKRANFKFEDPISRPHLLHHHDALVDESFSLISKTFDSTNDHIICIVGAFLESLNCLDKIFCTLGVALSELDCNRSAKNRNPNRVAYYVGTKDLKGRYIKILKDFIHHQRNYVIFLLCEEEPGESLKRLLTCNVIHLSPSLEERSIKSIPNRRKKPAPMQLSSIDTTIGWDDIAGHDKVKNSLKRVMAGLFQPSEEVIQKRCGILLYGPPGTGKTLMAKVVANEYKMFFIPVKGPELLDMYVGQSEASIRNVFKKAKINQPCVIFFDEFDSIAGINKNSNHPISSISLVSQILSEIDKVLWDPKCQKIMLMAATNRLDLIDPSLLRPGRFDLIFNLGNVDSEIDCCQVLKVATKNYCLADDVDLVKLSKSLPHPVPPADIASVASKALKLRLFRNIEKGQTKEKVSIKMCDFFDALIH